MDQLPAFDPVLKRLLEELKDIYRGRIERVVLFGSRVRGDAQPDSDYDVVVFLRDLNEFNREAATIARLGTDILFDTGAVINAIPMLAGSHAARTGLMLELRRDEFDL